MTLQQIEAQANTQALSVFGAFHTTPQDALGDIATVVLLGPHEPGFWPHVQASPEFGDTAPNPMDRWSERVVGVLGDTLGASATFFPFGGPPYRPFINWALRSGQAWQSPVSLLVHHRAGLFASYRGALGFTQALGLPSPAANPCETCAGQPCLGACPVNALTPEGYDLAACHRFLDTVPGGDCMGNGCAVRRACPVGQRYGRASAQSAFHMRAFHP